MDRTKSPRQESARREKSLTRHTRVRAGRARGLVSIWAKRGTATHRKESEVSQPPSENGRPLWRITCFVVHKKYHRRGVARTALRAALTAIQSEGGGLIEAYPIKRWGAYQEYRGTVSMFEKEGFQIVAPLGESSVLMRKTI